MKRKFHVRCEAGENLEITSKSYLSLSDLADLGTVSCLDCCWVGIQCWRCERCTVRAVQ